MDYSLLLASDNYSQNKRGIRIFTCELESNPIETLNDFPKYSKSLVNLFFNSVNSSLIYAAITPGIIRYASLYVKKLLPDINFDILRFCIECLRHCQSNDMSFYLSLDVYDVTYYSGLVETLIAQCNESFDRLSIQDIVTLIQCNLCQEFMESKVDLICEKMAEDPKFSAEAFLLLFQSKQGSKVVNACIKKACQKNSQILSYLPTEIAILSTVDKELTNLLQSHSKMNFPPFSHTFSSELKIIRLCKSPASTVKLEVQVEDTKVHNNRKTSIMPPQQNNSRTTISEDATGVTNMCLKNSAIEKIKNLMPTNNRKVNLKIENFPQQHHSSMYRKMRSPSLVMTPKVLHAWGVKKGGLSHNSYQKRYFDFYSSARCLIWREQEKTNHIKGVIVLPDTAKVTPTLNNKGYQYHIIIEPEQGQKTYDIAFEKENVCNQWAQALQSLCTDL